MDLETILFQLMVLFLGVLVTLLAWLGNRLFKKLDELIGELHMHNAACIERHHKHDSRIRLLEVIKH